MTEVFRTMHGRPEGYASPVVARIAWQMDEQRKLVEAAVEGMTAADLEWQPAPGMNSIGMLLAHLAVSENHMVTIGVEGKSTSDPKAVVGLTFEEEGMPLAADAPPSPALAGRDVAFFGSALARARAYTHRVLRTVTDADLERVIVRPRPDGSRREFDVAWMLYHLLEHEAGHRGQIQVLRHLLRSGAGRPA